MNNNDDYINLNDKILFIQSHPKQIGGFGSIHLAINKANDANQLYAVKILNKGIYKNNKSWIDNEICIL